MRSHRCRACAGGGRGGPEGSRAVSGVGPLPDATCRVFTEAGQGLQPTPHSSCAVGIPIPAGAAATFVLPSRVWGAGGSGTPTRAAGCGASSYWFRGAASGLISPGGFLAVGLQRTLGADAASGSGHRCVHPAGVAEHVQWSAWGPRQTARCPATRRQGAARPTAPLAVTAEPRFCCPGNRSNKKRFLKFRM